MAAYPDIESHISQYSSQLFPGSSSSHSMSVYSVHRFTSENEQK